MEKYIEERKVKSSTIKADNEKRRIEALLQLAKTQNTELKSQIIKQAAKIELLEAGVEQLKKSDDFNMRAIKRLYVELGAVQSKLREYEASNTAA